MKQKAVKAVKVRPQGAEADKDELDENGRIDMGGGVTKDPKTGKLYNFEGKPLVGKEAEAAEAGWRPRMDRRASHWSQHFKVDDIMSRPERVDVVCNGVRATFLVREFKMLCQCSQCKGQGVFCCQRRSGRSTPVWDRQRNGRLQSGWWSQRGCRSGAGSTAASAQERAGRRTTPTVRSAKASPMKVPGAWGREEEELPDGSRAVVRGQVRGVRRRPRL